MNAGAAGVLTPLAIDVAAETERTCAALRRQVTDILQRRGVVVGLSGGIDSSVCAALAARALGPNRVLGVLMPEADSAPESLLLGQLVADTLGIPSVVEDIRPALDALGCYARRDAALRTLVPAYGPGWRSKLVIADAAESRIAVSSAVVESPCGEQRKVRLTAAAYRAIVAATNFKQRVRATVAYYHAERLHFAVAGTPNRLEYDQGFFVKGGDGAADVKPIAHLYKSQVYQLAVHLGVPGEIVERPSTTDTFSLPQSQEEFYFSVPLEQFDLCLYGRNHGLPPAAIADMSGLTEATVEATYASIDRKRRATAYLHLPPLTVDDIPEVGSSPCRTLSTQPT